VNTTIQQRLQQLRNALLDLHKTLVDSERVTYEITIGAIQSPNHFLQLLIADPWFAWLHPLSQLIVALDETLEEKEAPTNASMDEVVNQTRRLLVASEDGEGFAQNYFDALQRDPAVVLAHGEVAKILGSPKAAG
jgi:phosphoglycolate phosphatase-like HAD superfamily hydrolase